MRFRILCRCENPQADNLAKILQCFGEVKIVEDTGPLKAGYDQLCSSACYNKRTKTTAWDRAFYDLDAQTTWFVEDDVVASYDSFAYLFDNTKERTEELLCQQVWPTKDDTWYWWNHPDTKMFVDYRFPHPSRSFNPICRLTRPLVQKVLDFRCAFGRFCFHEILFASLATTYYSLRDLPGLDMSYFRWRPEIGPADLESPTKPNHHRIIYHPVKNTTLHTRICEGYYDHS